MTHFNYILIFLCHIVLYSHQMLLKPVEEMRQNSSEEIKIKVKVKHYNSKSKSPKEENLTVIMKPNSLGEFSFNVSKDDNKLELEVNIIFCSWISLKCTCFLLIFFFKFQAQFEDKESGKVVKAHLEVLPFSTRNKDGHFLQVLMKQKPPKVVVSVKSYNTNLFTLITQNFMQVGETLKVKVESTFPTSEVLYHVFCQPGLVLSGKFVAPSPATKHDLSLVLPQNVSHLLSSPRLVVEVLSPSNEILSDSLRFVEQKKESPVRIKKIYICNN